MRSPHEQILDLVVKMDARGARKVRDMADAHLRDLDAENCRIAYNAAPAHVEFTVDVAEGAELQRGLEAAVILERERLDGPDDDSEEPTGVWTRACGCESIKGVWTRACADHWDINVLK